MASSSLGVGLLSQHQVFVNFRGDELRTGFISFLTDALKENGVNYFVDELENRGEDLKNLFKRIEESSIALVIFSKRYSESMWCLDELVKIEEQVDRGQLKAIPIFYKVETSDVKGLEQEFGNNFMTLAGKLRREQLRVEKWEKALLSISGKMGLTLKNYGNEKSFTRKIIKEVKKVLNEISSKEIETNTETEELGTRNLLPQMAKYWKIGEPIAFKEDHKKKETELHPTKNIVLVGRTGNGKSATGNSILGQKVFISKLYSSGVTKECKSFRCVTPTGRILNVIDTPGLFDRSVSAEFILNQIVKCLDLADGGIHAVLLVLSLRNRISEEEDRVLSTLKILFGSKVCDYLIVVFTAGDVLEEEGLTFDEYVGEVPDFLKRVFTLCGNRKIVFDNKTTDEAKKTKQVHDLLNLVDQVKKQNNNTPYTDQMYYQIKAENEIKQAELERISEMMAQSQGDSQLKELEGGCAIL